MRDKLGRFVKGNKAPKTAFKKGIIPWNKGKNGSKGFWTGKKMSKKHKKNLSKSHIGQKSWNKGKKFIQISGNKHWNWKGGKYKDSEDGYIYIKSNNKFCDKRGYMLEHRLICINHIGNNFKNKYDVHHINKIKDDNRINNLMVFINTSAHQRFHNNPNNVKPEEIIFDGRNI